MVKIDAQKVPGQSLGEMSHIKLIVIFNGLLDSDKHTSEMEKGISKVVFSPLWDFDVTSNPTISPKSW